MWVTVRTYDAVHEAELGRIRLDSCGVHARIEDDGAIGIMPHLSAALGGVKLLVHVDDAELAVELLDAEDIQLREEGGPYRNAVTRDRLSSDPPPAVDTTHADAIATRAFNTAVVGLIICPGIAHVYALTMLNALSSKSVLSPKGRKAAGRARVISLVVVALAVVTILRRFVTG